MIEPTLALQRAIRAALVAIPAVTALVAPRSIVETIVPGTSSVMTVPRPPMILAPDGKREWKRVAPILVARGVLTEADFGILESYCMAFARAREAERIIIRDGATIIVKGEHKRHPASTLQDAAIKTARLCANELGLTPVSRSRSNFMADDGDDSDLD